MLHHSSLRSFIALVSILGIISFPVFAANNKESLVKAAFIINFTRFIEWSGDKSISKRTKIDVCVLGDSDIINAFDFIKDSSPSNVSIILVKENILSNISPHCHMLFISQSEESRLDDVLAIVENKQVLTIADSSSFAERGVMMGLVKEENKIKLVINKKSIVAAGLYVDAGLLEIASKVIDK
jgi:hypothetical protein